MNVTVIRLTEETGLVEQIDLEDQDAQLVWKLADRLYRAGQHHSGLSLVKESASDEEESGEEVEVFLHQGQIDPKYL
jgi:hypothetical protein